MEIKWIFNHPLTNPGMQKCYQNEPRFDGVLPRDNLPKKIKDGTYAINLDEYVGTNWIALFCRKREFFFRVQSNDSIMCGYLCIRLIGFMLADENLVDFSGLFSPH